MFAGPALLGFLGPQYASAWVLLPVLVPALLLSCVTQVYYGLCRAQGRLFESTVVAVLAAILVVAPAAAVAQQYGLTGVSVLWAVAQADGGVDRRSASGHPDPSETRPHRRRDSFSGAPPADLNREIMTRETATSLPAHTAHRHDARVPDGRAKPPTHRNLGLTPSWHIGALAAAAAVALVLGVWSMTQVDPLQIGGAGLIGCPSAGLFRCPRAQPGRIRGLVGPPPPRSRPPDLAASGNDGCPPWCRPHHPRPAPA